MKKNEMLVPRLDFLIPIQWMSDTFTSGLWDRDEQKMIIGRVAELNPQWVEEVVNNLDHKLTDVLHDFKGIYSEDEHFLPRISSDIWKTKYFKTSDEAHTFMTDNGLYYECQIITVENGYAVEYRNDLDENGDTQDIIGDFDENGDAVDLKLKSIMMEKFDVKYQSDEFTKLN